MRPRILPITLLAVAACNTSNTVVPASTGGGPGQPGFQQVVTNGWLNYKANIVGVRESTVNENIRKIAVDVYSDQETLQRFSYRFEWFDASGVPLPSPTSAFTSVAIQPKQTVTLTSVAPSPAATDWRVTFLDQKH